VSTRDEALRRWRDDLAAWAIPQRILDQAPTSPWTPERAIFIRRATARRTRPGGISYHRAREALPPGGSVLDVGAGAGAASLPLLDRAGTLIAVDQDEQLLSELTKQAGGARRNVTTIIGSWPAVAARVPAADVVVCHHVLYNVPDLKPFVDALDVHARSRVVIEITARHPVARLNPLWERFHGLERPTRPTWEDALRTIRSFRDRVHAEREQIEADATAESWDELVGFTCRRLCLPPAREAEVAAALIEQGTLPTDPSSWSGPNRDVVTFWWDLD
jgi:2-polyprenyl-3-methyl-5-hydroxy-6-metoxy-1,4-benzoquinol methylase